MKNNYIISSREQGTNKTKLIYRNVEIIVKSKNGEYEYE